MARLVRRNAEPIDWQRVREQMARAEVSLDEALALSPDRAKALMDERARALARRVDPEGPAGEVLEVLTFSLGRERYAIDTRFVREVARFSDFTPVPSAPDFIVGIVGLRGEVLTIVDLRKFFSNDPVGLSDLSRVVVLGAETAELGVLADAVHSIDRLPSATILDAPEALAGVRREYVRGLTREALIVLSGAALLDDERLVVDQTETVTDR